MWFLYEMLKQVHFLFALFLQFKLFLLFGKQLLVLVF